MTSKAQITEWFNNSYVENATNMAVFMDIMDHEDYPVYLVASDTQDLRQKLNKKQDRLMEVYSYSVPLSDQIDLPRCFNYKVNND